MIIGKDLNEKQLCEIVERTMFKVDQDQDGKLSFEEFCTIFKENLF